MRIVFVICFILFKLAHSVSSKMKCRKMHIVSDINERYKFRPVACNEKIYLWY